jgi:hypothetical protein
MLVSREEREDDKGGEEEREGAYVDPSSSGLPSMFDGRVMESETGPGLRAIQVASCKRCDPERKDVSKCGRKRSVKRR